MKKIKSKILTGVCMLVFGVVSLLGMVACGHTKPNQTKIAARDVYAISAVSGMSYLVNLGGAPAQTMSLMPFATQEVSRPEYITNEEVKGIKNCLFLFEDMLGNDFSQTVKNNPDVESEYSCVMTISLGQSNSFLMYYNEIATETETEIDEDDGEIEVSSKLEGILVFGELTFDVLGERTVTTENDEVETSIEFTTRSKSDPSNSVTVCQTIENDEVEFEYKICKNDIEEQVLEIEIEYENGETELEFSLKQVAGETTTKTKYRVSKKADSDVYDIKITRDDIKDTMTATKTTDGYTLTFSNGAIENL